ncbi:MAG: transporter [Mucilaginibacter sp.]|nr:transporter [Mucilaginibacter sp.]
MKITNSKWLALTIILAAPFLSILDAFIMNVAVPSIKRGIRASDGEVQLMIAVYLLGYACFQITSGRIGDYLGRKRVFIAGMLFFTFTSCLCGLSVSPVELIAARFFQGIGAAIMTPQTIAMIQVIFPEQQERTKALGFYGIVMGSATILGQFLGGYLSDSHFSIAGWRLIFFVNLPVGVLAVAATAIFLRETSKKNNGHLDYRGVGMLTTALFCLIIPLILGREEGWPIWCFLLLILSGLVFFLFIKYQQIKLKSGGSPLVDITLFKIKDFNMGLIIIVFYFMMHTSYLLMISIYLQTGLGISPYQNGLFFIAFGLSATFASFLSIRAVSSYGKRVLQAGALILLLSFVLQARYLIPGAPHLSIYLQLGCYGFGAGIILPSLLNTALRSIPLHFAGAASGVYATVQQASSALGISIIGGVFYWVLSHSGQQTAGYVNAFHRGLYSEIACILFVIILLYLLPAKGNRQDNSPGQSRKSCIS